MARTNTSATEILKQEEQPQFENAKTAKKRTIRERLELLAPEIEKALPSVITPDRFMRLALTATRQNKLLESCEDRTLFGALLLAAQLGLEPNTPLGHAYIIPYKNNRTGNTEAQFQIGYKGLLDLAYRTGDFKRIFAYTVYENDEFQIEYGLDHKCVHVPKLVDRGEPIGYYAVYVLKNGGEAFVFMSIEDIKRDRDKYSQAAKSGKSSPWDSDFDAMAKKTVLKRLLKYAPLSTEYKEVLIKDDSKATLNYKEGEKEAIEIDYDIYDDTPLETEEE